MLKQEHSTESRSFLPSEPKLVVNIISMTATLYENVGAQLSDSELCPIWVQQRKKPLLNPYNHIFILRCDFFNHDGLCENELSKQRWSFPIFGAPSCPSRLIVDRSRPVPAIEFSSFVVTFCHDSRYKTTNEINSTTSV